MKKWTVLSAAVKKSNGYSAVNWGRVMSMNGDYECWTSAILQCYLLALGWQLAFVAQYFSVDWVKSGTLLQIAYKCNNSKLQHSGACMFS